MFKKPYRQYLFNKEKKLFKKKKNYFKNPQNYFSFFFFNNSFILKNDKTIFFYFISSYFYQKYPDKKNFFFFNKFFKIKYLNILSSFRYFFLKLKFYGKTFKWIFHKKKMKFRIQKPHRSQILFHFLKFKKKKKLKFKLRILCAKDKKVFINIIKQIKYLNIFTKKGMRVLKTFYNKKKGKVSGYM